VRAPVQRGRKARLPEVEEKTVVAGKATFAELAEKAETIGSDGPDEERAKLPASPYNLSTVEFGQLRGLGLSATQAKRVLRYRDERGGFRSLDELDQVPGFSKSFLTEIRPHLVL
jgi:DNA uptake protein ComE-like DNA-binding protein